MIRAAFVALSFCTVLQAKFEFSHTWNDWATHQPVLYQMAMNTTGPIIEFGCGNSSTDLLHEVCKKTGRLLITVEDDFAWMSKFTEKYLGDGYLADNSGWHKFFFVPGKKDGFNGDHWTAFLDQFEELLKTTDFDVCFVDQSPWAARAATIMRFKDKIKYIILHDCDYFPASGVLGTVVSPMDSKKMIPGVYDFSKTFKYFKVYFPNKPWPGKSGPPTLLGSNFESDLPDINYSQYK